MTRSLSQSLGWFSIGLGLAELLAPGKLAKFLGVEGNEGLLRILGLRELTNGIVVLSDTANPDYMWARVGGDALDLGLLGSALVNSRKKGSVAIATASVAAVTALDIFTALRLQQSKGDSESLVPAEERRSSMVVDGHFPETARETESKYRTG